MVSVNLKGGLGNMLFQIAFIEDLARRGGFDVRYPDIDETFQTLLKSGHSQNCYDYLNIFKNFDWKKNQDKPMPNRTVYIPHHYEYIEPVDNKIYDGYFQSERYFDRAETLKLFEPSDEIKKQISDFDLNGTSIHVRRGDYLKYADTYYCLAMGYYEEAMELIPYEYVDDIPQQRLFVIYSDDKEWVDLMFKVTKDRKNDPCNYIELFSMANCKNNIIANSSFSWWGAYLNQNPNKKVIAPAKWYKPGCKYSAKDIYCKNMIII